MRNIEISGYKTPRMAKPAFNDAEAYGVKIEPVEITTKEAKTNMSDAQNQTLPEPAATQLGEAIQQTQNALASERQSWEQTKEFYLNHPGITGAGRHIGEIMARLELLAHGVDNSEWELIGVSVGCAPGSEYKGHCKD